RQSQEPQHRKKVVQMPMQAELREHERLVEGKAEDGIADEYAATDKTNTGDDDQDGTKHAAPRMRRECQPEADSNQGNEDACNAKIHDLRPTERSDRQRTDRMAHPVVLRSSKPFDQKGADKEWRAQGTNPEQVRLHEDPSCDQTTGTVSRTHRVTDRRATS